MTKTINLAAARLMIGLRGDLSLADDDRRHLAHPAVGGVILFARNFSDGAQLRQLTADIRRIAARPLLIAADQEGGRVQRFCGGGFSSLPPPGELANAPMLLREAGMVMAAELLAAGVDLSFAPLLDIAHGRSEIIGDRAFGSDSDSAAAAALSFAEGMRAAGMASCGKHFPGHGFASADSHKTLPTDGRDFSEIAAKDLRPFAQWSERGMPSLMTAHIVYPKCDKLPATFSPYWLKTILREKLNYAGMIVSDDLAMAGADIGGIAKRMEAAVAAGCDGLLVCEPSLAAEALSACKKEAAENPWLALSPCPDNRTSVGDFAYARAKKALDEFSRGG